MVIKTKHYIQLWSELIRTPGFRAPFAGTPPLHYQLKLVNSIMWEVAGHMFVFVVIYLYFCFGEPACCLHWDWLVCSPQPSLRQVVSYFKTLFCKIDVKLFSLFTTLFGIEGWIQSKKWSVNQMSSSIGWYTHLWQKRILKRGKQTSWVIPLKV